MQQKDVFRDTPLTPKGGILRGQTQLQQAALELVENVLLKGTFAGRDMLTVGLLFQRSYDAVQKVNKNRMKSSAN